MCLTIVERSVDSVSISRPFFFSAFAATDSSMPEYLDSLVHFERFRTWLQMEGEAERERMEERRKIRKSADAERGGETLLGMSIRTHTSGLGGRYLITLEKRRRQDRLPWNRFRSGSPIVLSPDENSSGNSVQGVVSGRRMDSIEVAVNEWPDASVLRVDLCPDEVTRKRQLAAMQNIQDATGRPGQLRDVLLYRRDPVFHNQPNKTLSGKTIQHSPPNHLNDSQKAAVEFAMSASDLAIIHGPPGTGKTTTVVEVIRQAVARGERVLACAPSNTAVDNLLERLVNAGEPAVRLGHPARVLESVRRQTLDALVEQHDAWSVISDMLKEAEQLERKAGKFTRAKPAPGQKYQQRQEAKELKRHARMLEKQAIADVLSDARVVCATSSFDFSIIEDQTFHLLVIDEACQSVEPGCWVPLRFAERIVLAGDHCQLPPTILSTQAAAEGFAVSMMQRLVEHYSDQVTRQLQVQYRMNERIMEFSSMQFYDGSLTADASVKDHVLSDLPRVSADTVDDACVVFFDTAGAGWEEEVEEGSLSKRNVNEAKLVLDQVQQLCEAGLAPQDIAVIAPYAAQVRWLRQNAEYNKLEIDTVDGFQGREKEAVVMCTVRSNSEGEVGFLSDARRMNVALTRAKRKLIVIGDSATLGADPFFTELLQWFESIGAYRTVWELMSND